MEAKEYTGERHSYVWSTEQPSLKYTRESQTFSLKCIKWHFKFSASLNRMGEELWDLCMVYDTEPKVFWNITTYVKENKGTLDLLCSTDYKLMYNDIHQETKCPNLLTRIDSAKLQMNKHNYFQNDKITFVIILDELLNSIFDVEKKALGGWHKEIHSLEQLSMSMTKMFESKQYTDVEIQCEGQLFFAHRNVLIARSVVFAEMFQNNLPGVFTRKLYIKDVRCDVFKKFLIFLYTAKIELDSITSATEQYELAQRYDVFLLKERCFHFLKENIIADSVIDILFSAFKLGDDDLMYHALYFILTDENCFPSEYWLKLARGNPNLCEQFRALCNKYKINL